MCNRGFFSELYEDFCASLRLIYDFFLIILCIYFWLNWVFIAAHRLPLVAESGGYSLVAVLWVRGLLMEQSTAPGHMRSSSSGTQAQ